MRVIVAEDSGLYRGLLVQLLSGSGFAVIGEAASAEELLARVDADPPDLVLVDIRMPPTWTDDGLRAALEIRQRHPQVAIVVLSQYGEAEYATQLAQGLGRRAGYLLKERATGITELLDTVNRVVAGELVIDPLVVEQLLKRPRAPNPLERLSQRELQTLQLMAEGRSNVAIAERLHVTVAAVERHIVVIRQKLGLRRDEDDPLARQDSARVLTVLAYLRYTRQLPDPQPPPGGQRR
jgi:DNA-binding NarL/FixJ family response regulator